MKIRKDLLKIIIVISLIFILLGYYIEQQQKHIQTNEITKPVKQITLQSLPFSFSDIKIYDTTDKLHNTYTDVIHHGKTSSYAESLEFTCQHYYNYLSLNNNADTTVAYDFYQDKLIKKYYSIKHGDKLLDYIKDELTKEFGEPEDLTNNIQPPQTPSKNSSEASCTSPIIINTKYKWDMNDYIISLSTIQNFSDLEINFTIKEDVLVNLANTELATRLSDIDNLRFDKISSFYNGYSTGNIAGNWVLLNQDNNEVIIYKDYDVADYSYAQYGLLLLKSKKADHYLNHLYKFTDINGKTLIDSVNYYKKSPDGNIIVVASDIKHKKYDIIFIDNDSYNIVSTDSDSIGHFLEDSYDHNSYLKSIDKHGKMIQKSKGKNISAYHNGSTLISKYNDDGKWYYVVGDKYGNELSKDENHYIPETPSSAKTMFEKYGILETRFYKKGKPIEWTIQNSKGKIIYIDGFYTTKDLDILYGILKVTYNNKNIYYDYNGKLIEGVTEDILIPSNAFYYNYYSSNNSVYRHDINTSIMREKGYFDGSIGFNYTFLKTQNGDRLYSYKGLHYAFPEEYELDINKHFYTADNILFISKNKKLGKFGVVDINGNIVFDFIFDDIKNIVSSDIVQIGDELFDTNGNRVSGGLEALEYRYNSAIKGDSQGFYVLDLYGKPIIKSIRIIE